MTITYEKHHIEVIYKITNKVNGKIYVGSTQDLYNRHNRYKNASISTKQTKTPIHLAMRKYGFDNFDFEIIEKVEDKTKLIEREQHWLDMLKPYITSGVGYNVNPTAGSWLGRKHVEETRKLMSEQRKQRIMTKNDLVHLSNIRHLAANINHERLSIKIYQINKQTHVIINTFSSIMEAAKSVGIDASAISLVCSGKKTSAKGYYWIKAKDYDKNGFKPRKNRRRGGKTFYSQAKPVYQLSLEGVIIKTWSSIGEVVRILGYDNGHICKCCKGKSETHQGFKWKYVTGSDEIRCCKEQLAQEYTGRKLTE